jgi:hypothetical protein
MDDDSLTVARPVGRPPKKRTKTVTLVVDHVHLPLDLTTSDWRTAQETKRYDAKVDDKRAKYEVHPELADFLVSRDQAISLDD